MFHGYFYYFFTSEENSKCFVVSVVDELKTVVLFDFLAHQDSNELLLYQIFGAHQVILPQIKKVLNYTDWYHDGASTKIYHSNICKPEPLSPYVVELLVVIIINIYMYYIYIYFFRCTSV